MLKAAGCKSQPDMQWSKQGALRVPPHSVCGCSEAPFRVPELSWFASLGSCCRVDCAAGRVTSRKGPRVAGHREHLAVRQRASKAREEIGHWGGAEGSGTPKVEGCRACGGATLPSDGASADNLGQPAQHRGAPRHGGRRSVVHQGTGTASGGRSCCWQNQAMSWEAGCGRGSGAWSGGRRMRG